MAARISALRHRVLRLNTTSPGSLASALPQPARSRAGQRQPQPSVTPRRWLSIAASLAAKPRPPPEEDESAPVRFSTSGAASWKARDTFGGEPDDDSPWYQPLAVTGSVAALLIYFCVLREESDLDARLDGGLLQRVPGLERPSLEAYVHHQEAAGRNVDVERHRLDQLYEEERDKARDRQAAGK